MSLRHVVLSLLHHEPMTGYDIVKSFDDAVGYFWSASHQQVYRELGTLAARNWVNFRHQPQTNRPDKKIYSISNSGREELLRWAQAPLAPRPVREPFLVKLLSAEAVGRTVVLDALDRQRVETEKTLAAYHHIEQTHYATGDSNRRATRDRMLYAALRRGILSARAYLDWLDETRIELEALAE